MFIEAKVCGGNGENESIRVNLEKDITDGVNEFIKNLVDTSEEFAQYVDTFEMFCEGMVLVIKVKDDIDLDDFGNTNFEESI